MVIEFSPKLLPEVPKAASPGCRPPPEFRSAACTKNSRPVKGRESYPLAYHLLHTIICSPVNAGHAAFPTCFPSVFPSARNLSSERTLFWKLSELQLGSDFLLLILAPGFHPPRFAVPFSGRILSSSSFFL